MTIRNLEIFVKVADCGSMTAAAEQLFIAQPTVSQAVSELEDHYGIKLFDRLSKRLYITEDGKNLLNYARHIISLSEEMDMAMKDREKSGIIKVGASLTIGAELLPRLVNRFAEEYEKVKIHVIVKNTTEIENLIVRNEIDLALVEGIIHNPNIVSRPFMDDELVLVCGKTHPLYGKDCNSLPDVLQYDFIVREKGSGTRELFESAMISKSASWSLIWECNGSDSIKSAAAGGIGIAVISKRLVEKELNSGILDIIAVPGLDLRRKFNIVYHKNKYITDTMKAFMDLV